MYTLTCIDNPWIGLFYQAFTFPRFRPRLQALKPQGLTIASAASDSNQPIGLALAEIEPDGKSAEVLSIFVEPDYRRQGIGLALLIRLEQELFSRGCISAELVYTTGQPTTPALERLLQKCNWASPQARMLLCKASLPLMMKAPWLEKATLPSSYTIFPWAEITQDERIAIQQQQEVSPWIPKDLNPFKHEENFEPLNSLGLRYQGQVVGWIITHRLATDTIRYSCGFVNPDLQKRGVYISLIANAIQIQYKEKIIKGIWTVPLVHTPMVHFVKKRMAPYLTSLEETRGSFKLFSGSAVPGSDGFCRKREMR